MKSKHVMIALFLLAIAVLAADPAIAQCPMCRMSAESSLKEGSKHALGLNTGILYLLAFPYALCAALFLLWHRNNRKNRTSAG